MCRRGNAYRQRSVGWHEHAASHDGWFGDNRAPAVPETAHAHALLECFFQGNPVDRPSAGDLADAFAPLSGISGVRDVMTEL